MTALVEDPDLPLSAETVNTKVQDPEEDEPEAQVTPEAAPAAAQATERVAPAGEQAPTIDLSKVDPDELLKARPELRSKLEQEFLDSDSFKRAVQSATDKGIAAERRRISEDARKRSALEAQKAAEEERRRLIELEDLEGLGQLELERIREADTLLKAAEKMTATLEEIVRQDPDLRVLGDDRMTEIYDSVRRQGGSIHDLEKELWLARGKLDVDAAIAKTSKTIEERVAQEVEAALARAGVEQRTERVKTGQSASESISGGATARPSQEEETYESMSKKFGEGETSWEEFKPYKDAHEKARKR